MTKRVRDEEEGVRGGQERLSGGRRRGLHIVPPTDQEKRRKPVPADESLRELIKQVQRPAPKKVPPKDDLPPAA